MDEIIIISNYLTIEFRYTSELDQSVKEVFPIFHFHLVFLYYLYSTKKMDYLF